MYKLDLSLLSFGNLPPKETEIDFRLTERPPRLNPKFFNSEGNATDFLSALVQDIQEAWRNLSNPALRGLFVGGSQAEGVYSESSDLDIVVYPAEGFHSVIAERSRLVSQLTDKHQILEDWGQVKRPGDIDFIITSRPFGRLYDLDQNIWVSGLKKHPKMFELRKHFLEIPDSFFHLNQDLGKMNQYFWDLENGRTADHTLTAYGS